MLLTIIYLFGTLITLAGIIMLVKPEVILKLITDHAENPVLFGAAIVIRLVVGLLLLTYANLSRFPKMVIFFGWIAVIASVAIAWMGQERFTRLVTWIAEEIQPYGRVGGGVALLFGLFILYSFL